MINKKLATASVAIATLALVATLSIIAANSGEAVSPQGLRDTSNAVLLKDLAERNLEVTEVGPATDHDIQLADQAAQGDFNFLNDEDQPSLVERVTFTDVYQQDPDNPEQPLYKDHPAIMIVFEHQPAPVSGPMTSNEEKTIQSVDSTYAGFVDAETGEVLDALTWSK